MLEKRDRRAAEDRGVELSPQEIEDHQASQVTAELDLRQRLADAGVLHRNAHGNEDAGLWVLIKTKFVGYFRWTAFAMLLAPVAFWITSR
jgi:hypothetical protein